MRRFRNILVYVEDNAHDIRCLDAAVRLAERNKAHLRVVTTVNELPPGRSTLSVGSTRLDIRSLIVGEKKRQLSQLIGGSLKSRGRIIADVLEGEPFIRIIQEVMWRKHDLLFTTAERRRSISEVLFGTTTMHLMRKCPCPVWVFKSQPAKGFLKILAPIDPDPSNPVNSELNDLILDLSFSLLRDGNGTLDILHAWSAPAEPILRVKAKSDSRAIANYVLQEKRMHQEWVNRATENYPVDAAGVGVHLLKGNPREVIPSFASKRKHDLIVMATVSRTGIPGFFIGNTAESVLQEVHCSVLTVKPKDFVSPVGLNG